MMLGTHIIVAWGSMLPSSFHAQTVEKNSLLESLFSATGWCTLEHARMFVSIVELLFAAALISNGMNASTQGSAHMHASSAQSAMPIPRACSAMGRLPTPSYPIHVAIAQRLLRLKESSAHISSKPMMCFCCLQTVALVLSARIFAVASSKKKKPP
jgi:hypothetical protein